MKKATLFFLVLFLVTGSLLSQSPQAFKYQAMARDQSGNILSNWDIGIRISIIKGNQQGKQIYTETHQTISNPFGIINIIIGEGDVVIGDFKDIQWGIGKYSIKMEIDLLGEGNYKEMGNTQFYAVPYALYAEKAGSLLESGSEGASESSSGNGSRSLRGGVRDVVPNSKMPADGDSWLNVNVGLVGIGTDNPQEKLDVHGVIRTDSLFSFQGNAGLTDTTNIVTDIDYVNSSLRYKTVITGGGIITFVSEKSLWTNSVGNPLIEDTSTFVCGDLLKDIRDGKKYPTALIGDQCWMAKGLNIGIMLDSLVKQTDNGLIEKYCYRNEQDSCQKFGALYQWRELMGYHTIESIQGICPAGWHVPSDGELKVLEGAADTQHPVGDPEWDGTGWRGFDVAKRLKSTTGWFYNDNGTDVFGFNGLPAGWHDTIPIATFRGNGSDMDMWSSTEHNFYRAWQRTFWAEEGRNYDSVWRYHYSKNYGMPLRCVKDMVACGHTFIDSRDGQAYGTAQIGDQCWMTENMNIGTILTGSTTANDNEDIEKYCHGDNPSNCDAYGGIYTWDEMMQYETAEGSQGICPAGWHIPTDSEWITLEGFVDTDYDSGDPEWLLPDWRGYDVGDHLKSVSGWSSGGNGSDTYGFTALPSGYRTNSYTYAFLGSYGYCWTSTERFEDQAWQRHFHFSTDESSREGGFKTYGFSARCLKD